VLADGSVTGSGTPWEVFYDDDLLSAAALHPPPAVEVAREVGLAETVRPVTRAELAAAVDGDRPVAVDTPADGG